MKENETLLRALQESMRKLTDSGIHGAVNVAQLREKAEQSRRDIEACMRQQAAATREHERVCAEAKALRDHVDELMRLRADPVLVSTLQDELNDLKRQETETKQEAETLRARVRAMSEALEAVKAELATSEANHRKLTDQAMKLREHLERVEHP
jgi:predicted nuclease with TOPRIM domain